jgi:YihY family inner membrane protein
MKRDASPSARFDPLHFALRVLRAFRANQGFLLAGAIAYYTLLSIVPLFTLLILGLSHFVDAEALTQTLTRYLALVIPGETGLITEQIRNFLAQRDVAGWVLLAALAFFSSIAFTILENAMSVIFVHRVAIRRRHFLVSAVLPYLFIMLLGLGLLVTSSVATLLQALGGEAVQLLGRSYPLDRVAVALLYLLGLGGEALLLTSIYLVMPVGRLSVRHALIGGVAATVLWELTRRVLVWYFATLSLVNVVYGSLATTIAALLTLEVAAIILLLGAQVIAEYERWLADRRSDPPPEPLT